METSSPGTSLLTCPLSTGRILELLYFSLCMRKCKGTPTSVPCESTGWGAQSAQSGTRGSGDLGYGWGTAEPQQSAGDSNPFLGLPRVLVPWKCHEDCMGHCPDHSGLSPETLSVSGESGFLAGERRKRERKLTGLWRRWAGLWLLMETWRSVQATSVFISADSECLPWARNSA